MGEYCNFGKMGTCEEMYYLRAHQRGLVQPDPGSLNPADKHILPQIRFRFPWPDEDWCGPCEIGDWPYNRSIGFHTVDPVVVEHGSIQWQSAGGGYLVSLPCPEAQPTGYDLGGVMHPIHRNGHPGRVQLAQVGYRKRPDGSWHWVPILRCTGCGVLAQATDEQILQMAEELSRLADNRERDARCLTDATDLDIAQAGAWHRGVALRLMKLADYCECDPLDAPQQIGATA